MLLIITLLVNWRNLILIKFDTYKLSYQISHYFSSMDGTRNDGSFQRRGSNG